MSKLFLTVCVLFTSLAALPSAFADLGPKPTAYFAWASKTTLKDVRLLQCKSKSCDAAEPLIHVGPQRFHCCADGCYAIAYGFSEFSALEGKLDGKTVRSEPFDTTGMEIYFDVSAAGGKVTVTKSKSEFTDETKNRLLSCP